MFSVVLLIIGFIVLITSADWLVDGSSSLAGRFKISPLVIGLTVVAFGTSFPELVVNSFASISGSTGLVTGNIIGSNIANILLILGAAAIIYPLKVQNSTVWKEIPFSLLAACMLWVLVSDTTLGGQLSNGLSRADGFVLFAFFAIFMYYIISVAKGSSEVEEETQVYSPLKTSLLIVAGLIGLFFGGKWVVDSATTLALYFGISERVIGLTVVAIGTSLPELVTSCIAAFKKQTDISIGNVIGSNIFNIFWILPVSISIAPFPVPASIQTDILVLVSASLLLFGLLFVGRKFHLTKWEGILFLLAYCIYTVQLVVSG